MSETVFQAPPAAAVRIDDGFWSPRIDAVRTGTVGVFYQRCREAGMFDHIDPDVAEKPRRALAGVHGMSAQRFWDSDIGKLIEMAGYVLLLGRDAELEARIDALVDKLGRMQQPDGYLNSWFIYQEPGKRWTNLRDDHELYCAGHLIEGAVAYWRATGKRTLLDIVCRYADLIAATFGTGPGQKRGYCGHPEIEMALVELHRATGEMRYLDLARYFIDERGRQPHYYDSEARARGVDPAAWHFGSYEYCQAHKPVREQDKVVGHAVRAMYLYSGMADIAAETGDASLAAACERLWGDLVSKRLYVTGGMGPSAANEGFTADYDLPNRTAYAETCAAVGLVFWASRMLRLGPDRRYADMMELALYNGALSGLSLDGTLFFYENPLESRGDHRRWKWHRCPCCPPNIGRLIASLGRYVYGVAADAIAVHLFVGGEAKLTVANTAVHVAQKTRYPWDGAVSITLAPDQPTEFELAVRIPGWSPGATLRLNGKTLLRGDMVIDAGYARIRRRWSKGDWVEIDLKMAAERIHAHPDVADDAGRVALRRGPLLYCLEGADNPVPLHRLILADRATVTPQFDGALLGGMMTLLATASSEAGAGWENTLYRNVPPQRAPAVIKAVPYFAWDNREAGEMLVWIRSE
jgi:DUF1680 family protein